MSAVSMPMPITRIRTRTIRFGPVLGARFSCSSRAFSICWICSATSWFRGRSRFNSASVLGGMASPSGVRNCSRRSGDFSSLGSKLRMPRRVSVADAVDDGGVLANEGVALAVGALGILLREGRDGGHLAVVPLAAQPAQKGALELLGVEPIGLGAPVLARHRHARGMNDMGLDTARSQPAGQPEAVPAGLEGDGDARDLVP